MATTVNLESRENLKAAGILLFFGMLILYAGHYLIGGIAVVGSVLVALAPTYMHPEFSKRLFRMFGFGQPGPIRWYQSPLPYIALAGGAYALYAFAT